MLTPKERGGGAAKVFPMEIANSVLLDTARLDTPNGTPTNQTKCTVNLFAKVGMHSVSQCIVKSSANNTQLYITTTGALIYLENNVTIFETQAGVIADSTAHRNIHLQLDASASGSNKVQLVLSGKPYTDFVTDARSSFTSTFFTAAGTTLYIGDNGGGAYFKGNMSHFRIIDGQALPAATFGQFSDQVTGLWVPKEVVIPEADRAVAISRTAGTIIHTMGGRTEHAFDGLSNEASSSSAYCTTADCYIGKDYGAGNETTVHKAVVNGCSNYGLAYSGSGTLTATLRGSNDNSNWDELASKTFTDANSITVELESTDKVTKYRYVTVRVYDTNSSADIYISELTFYSNEKFTWGTNGRHYKFDNAANLGEDSGQAKVAQDPLTGPNLMLNATGYQSSYYDSSQAALFMFDNLASTFWQAATGANNPQWAAGKPANPFAMAAYSLLIRDEGGIENRVPQSWQLQGSNDSTNGSNGTWDVLDTQTNKTLTRGNTYTYEIPNTTVYAMYRIYVTQTGSETLQGNISELRGYGVLPDASPNDATVNGSPVQTLDTPTNNYATLNPFAINSSPTVSEGNLRWDDRTSGGGKAYCSMFPRTSKFYCEVELIDVDQNANPPHLGLAPAWQKDQYNYLGIASEGTYGCLIYEERLPETYNASVYYKYNGANVKISTFSRGCQNGDIYAMAYDVDSGKFWLRHPVDGWDGDPVAGTGAAFEGITGDVMFSAFGQIDVRFNFGATGFTHTPPSGFKPLCQSSLPDPTVMKSASAAQVITRVGDGDGITNLTEAGLGSGTSNRASAYSSTGIFNYTGTTLNDGWHNTQLASDYHRYTFTDPQVINRVKIQNRSDQTTYAIRSCIFQGSHDGSVWDTLATISGREVTAGLVTTHNVTNTTAYKYYQITNMVGDGSYTDLAYMQFGKYNETVTLTPDMEGGPDFVNMKARTETRSWFGFDSVRGANKALFTDISNAQVPYSDTLMSFDSTGYTLGKSGSINAAGHNYLDLCLKAGVNNGFEIVQYTGDGVAGRQITHNLGKVPTFVIVKCISNAAHWTCYHVALGPSAYIYLNDTAAAVTSSGMWNNTLPTATTFTLSDSANVNNSGWTYVAYLFTDSDIFKAFSYAGNLVVDGPFVNLGGKVLSLPFIKNTGIVSDWYDYDAIRNPFNPIDTRLFPNTNSIEGVVSTPFASFTSTGLKIVSNAASVNGSGNLIVGLAILESTKYSNAF